MLKLKKLEITNEEPLSVVFFRKNQEKNKNKRQRNVCFCK